MKAIKFIAMAVCVAAIVASCNGKAQSVEYKGKVLAELPTAGQVDSASYLIGINFGSFLKYQCMVENLDEVNMAEIKKGMEDFLKAEGNPRDEKFVEQFKVNLNDMNMILGAYIDKKASYKAAANLVESEEWLAKNALKENVDTTASGLQYTIVAEGAEHKIAPKDTVWVNYKGTLIDGKEFDKGDSTRFVANQVITGWTEGLGLIGEGGKATLYIPADLAYGERGTRDGSIGPNCALVFEVEVLRVGEYVEPVEEEK